MDLGLHPFNVSSPDAKSRTSTPAKTSILLIEGGQRILPSYAESLSEKAAERLEKLGVTVMTGTSVERVDEQGVIVAGKRVESATVLWTAGVAPSPILSTLGVTTDHAGRVCVGPFLEIPDKPGRLCQDNRMPGSGAEG